MEKNQNAEWAKQYLNHYWPAIPLGQKPDLSWKQALVPWQSYENMLPTEADIASWWNQWPFARVGIITGKISKLVVVDIDPRHGGNPNELDLPPTLIASTGGGGWHYYYRYPEHMRIKSQSDIKKGVDIRAEGGLVVAPPSEHISGKKYEWQDEFDPSMIAPCPDWIIEINKDMAIAPSRIQSASPLIYGRDPLSRALNAPINEVICYAAKAVGVSVSFRQNGNRTCQIIEDGRVTSGFISSQGNYCYSASGKLRRGNPINVAEYYINVVGGRKYSRSQIIKTINNL